MAHPALNYRPLGSTGIQVSELAFGAGPVAALMTGGKSELQRMTIQRALDIGINWFDTAATYGDGRSEENLGAALREFGMIERVHIATKVRLMPEHLSDIKANVRASVTASLKRLGLARLTLIQLHNSITANRGDQPASLTPRDVLGKGGVLEVFEDLRRDGLCAHLGLTGIGDAMSISEVIRSAPWATIQCPFNILSSVGERELVVLCEKHGLAVLAIRVFAGGALAGQAPSEHTKRTAFFPLALYESDQRRAAELRDKLPSDTSLKEAAMRFVFNCPGVATAIIGFAKPEQVEEAARFAQGEQPTSELLHQLQAAVNHA
jgi:aryl-alcohol dehydrogenase-like predicted oxidoreductase